MIITTEDELYPYLSEAIQRIGRLYRSGRLSEVPGFVVNVASVNYPFGSLRDMDTLLVTVTTKGILNDVVVHLDVAVSNDFGSTYAVWGLTAGVIEVVEALKSVMVLDDMADLAIPQD